MSGLTSSEKGEADILEDMVDQMPSVPDTKIVGSQRVWFQWWGAMFSHIGMPYV